MRKTGNEYIDVPVGHFDVFVTLADVSGKLDGSHLREAYAKVQFSKKKEVYRKVLEPTLHGTGEKEFEDEEYIGFPVDSGTACFVDAEFIEKYMPDEETWYEDLFENEREDCWFNIMDDPNHIRDGLANIILPYAYMMRINLNARALIAAFGELQGFKYKLHVYISLLISFIIFKEVFKCHFCVRNAQHPSL